MNREKLTDEMTRALINGDFYPEHLLDMVGSAISRAHATTRGMWGDGNEDCMGFDETDTLDATRIIREAAERIGNLGYD